jgi:hypothetical protein
MLAVRRLAAAGLLVTGEQASALPKRDRRPESRQQVAGPRPAGPLGPQVNADPTDIELLLRLKKALEELS